MVDVAEGEKAVLELERTLGGTITASEFLRLNLQRFKATGLSRRTIYDSLTRSGLKLGTFAAFSKCWSWLESGGTSSRSKAGSNVKAADVEEVFHNGGTEIRSGGENKPEIKAPEKSQKAGLGLRPIRLANGAEVEITQTGAKMFKI